MAIDFYKLGSKSGATTPKGQKSGLQSLVGSIDKTVSGMLTASKAATAALTAAMPAGVAIDKVPEQLRGKVSQYLADNKKAYTDAAKVVSSGINPQSQRYKDAIETMNRVGSKFENLSATLEDIAVKRKAALDDPNFSPATSDIDVLTFENLKNGSIYESMTLNEDGTFNYTDGKGASKAWSDFAIAKQNFTGQNAYLGAVKEIKDYKLKNKNASWNDIEGTYQNTFDLLFNKLGPKGSADFAFADEEFLNSLEINDKIKEELKQDPAELISAYKDYVMEKLEQEYTDSAGYFEEFDKPIIFGGYRTKRDIDFMNDDITNEKSFTGFDNVRYTFKDGFYYEEDDPETTVDESAKPLSKDEVRSYNQISNFYTGANRPSDDDDNNDEEDFVPDNLAPKEAKRAMQKQVMAISDGPGTLEQKNKRINQIKKAFSEKYPNINN